MRSLGIIAALAAVALLGILVLGFNLGGYAVWDPDEARHAEIAREIFAATDWRGWLLPSFNFRPYHDKPILFYWLVSAAYAGGGVTELAARSIPAGAALLTTLSVTLWACRAWSVAAGVASAVVLLTAGEFVALGRYANLDMTLTLWITLGMLAVHGWAERGRSLAPAALWAGLGALTKGLVAPVLIAGGGLSYLAATQRLRLLTRMRFVRTTLVFLAVAGPWYLAAGWLDPDYMYEFFVRHHFQRYFHEERYLHPGPIYYYLPMLIVCFFPWSALLPSTLMGTLRRERRGASEVFCACWALTVIAFFSLSKGKLGTYILPALPPLALLTGRFVARLFEENDGDAAPTERKLVSAGAYFISAVLLASVPVLVALSSRLYEGAFVKTSFLAAVMIPIGVLGIVTARHKAHRAFVTVLALGMVGGFLAFYRWAAPVISQVRSEAPLAALLEEHAAENADAAIVAFSVRTPSLLFYIRRPVKTIDYPEQLGHFLSKHPLTFVVTAPAHVPDMLEVGKLYPWRTGMRHVLYATKPRGP